MFSERRSLRRDGQELLGYERILPGSAVALSNPDLANVWYPTMIGSALFEQVRERKGGLLDIQLRPSDTIDVGFNAFVSKQDAANYNRNYLLWVTHFLAQGNGQVSQRANHGHEFWLVDVLGCDPRLVFVHGAAI